MISIQQIQYIIAVYETGSFSKASEQCFVTQPTLSMQIKKAEEELGILLFDRTTQPIKISQKGKELLPELMELKRNFDAFDIKRKKMSGVFKEKIEIGIIPTISNYITPHLYGKWKTKYDYLLLHFFEFKTHELIEKIKMRELDLVIFAAPFQAPGLTTTSLYNEPILGYSKEVPKDSIQSISALKKLQPWILTKGNCLRTQMTYFCQLEENTPSETWQYEGNDIHVLMKMCKLYGGYTLLPYYFAKFEEGNDHTFQIVEDQSNKYPMREVIGVYAANSPKKKYIDTILQDIQSTFKIQHLEKGMKIDAQ